MKNIKINYLSIFLLYFLFTLSCKNNIPNDFKISGYHKNGTISEISKKIKDTLIDDSIFTLKYIKKYNQKGNLLNEGKFFNNNRIGKHYFYKKNKLNIIRNYMYLNKDDISFLFATNLFGDTIIHDRYTTYLNYEIVYTVRGDTSKNESSFIDIHQENKDIKLNDSIKFYITAYDAKTKIKSIDAYFYKPDNNEYLIIIHKNNNHFELNIKSKLLGKNNLKGYVILTVFNKNINDTIYAHVVHKINKSFFVNQ